MQDIESIDGDDIREEAINHVQKLTGLSRLWIERIHDFQWRLCAEAMSSGKSIYMPRMFRVVLRPKVLSKLHATAKRGVINADTVNSRKKKKKELKHLEELVKKVNHELGLEPIKRRSI